MTWREYHDETRHSVERLRQSRHFLDWANMPDPFRHYEGVPVVDLPAGARIGDAGADGAEWLSALLFHSAAVSATKVVAASGHRYALRVNPSSGNLHPTEFHFRTRGLKGWADGLYHYRASSHMAEQRGVGEFGTGALESSAPVVFLLTSIAWREAWKYQDRAYRYCLLDLGHAWESLALAARGMGCESFARGQFMDDEAAVDCGLPRDEWPMLAVEVGGGAVPVEERGEGERVWLGGKANSLSRETVEYRSILGVQAATRVVREGRVRATVNGSGKIVLPASAESGREFAEAVRGRRSALDFRGGEETMSGEQLAALLQAAGRPLAADFGRGRFVQLYLYVHRVGGLERGVYRHWAERGELELVAKGDQRVVAAGLSLGQNLAGNACVAFSMVADLERATEAWGDRGYRYVFFEAGAIGQRLYVAAEEQGLRGTGIGAFYDERVQEYLQVRPEEARVVYHFAIGYPVRDPRLEV